MKIIKILTARLINGREKATRGAQHSTSAKGAAQPIEIENSHKIQKQFEDERCEICRMPSSILPTTRSPVRFLLSFRCRHSEQGVLGDQEAFRTCFSPPHKKAYRIDGGGGGMFPMTNSTRCWWMIEWLRKLMERSKLSLIEFPASAKQIKHFKWFSLLSRNGENYSS